MEATQARIFDTSIKEMVDGYVIVHPLKRKSSFVRNAVSSSLPPPSLLYLLAMRRFINCAYAAAATHTQKKLAFLS